MYDSGGSTATQTPDGFGQANVAQSTNAAAPTAATVQNPAVPIAGYTQALQQAYAPQFADSQAALNANNAATGRLYSGAGAYSDQDLQAKDNATIASGLLPLIQQGYNNQNADAQQNAGAQNTLLGQQYGQDFQSSTGNANSINNFLSQLQGESSSAQQQNASLANQDALYNSEAYNNVLGQNTAAQNSYQGAQAGYANNQYASTLGDLYGLLSGQQSGDASIFGNGAGQAVSAYENGQALGDANQNSSSQGFGDVLGQLLAGGG